MIGNRFLIALVLVFIASFAVKFGYCVGASKLGVVAQDTLDYMAASDEVRKGNIFSSTNDDLLKFPGYPIYLTGLRFITGDDFLKLSVTSIVMYSVVSVLSCCLAYIAFGEGVAILTAPLVVFSPLMVFWSAYILTESLFTCLLLIAIISLAYMYRSKRSILWLPALGGFALGYASWTRPTLIMIIMLIPVWYFAIKRRNREVSGKAITVFIVVCLLVYGSWAIRNLIVTGDTHVPFPRVMDSVETKFYASEYMAGDKDVVALDTFQGYGVFEKVKYVIRKLYDAFIVFWHPSIYPTHQNFFNSNVIRYFVLFNCAYFILMLLSIISFKKNFEMIFLCWLPIVYFTVVHIVVAGWPNISRYRVPIEPYISILAGYSLYGGWLLLRKIRPSGQKAG